MNVLQVAIRCAAIVLVAAGCDDSGPTQPAARDELAMVASGDSVFYGRTLQVEVRLPDSVTTLDPARIIWSSSDTMVAVVDSAGRVLGTGIGIARITARIDSVFGTTDVRVVLRRADGGVEFDRAGHSHMFTPACVLTIAGRAYCMDRPATGDTTPVFQPVPGADALSFTEVGTGFGSACGLAVGGELYCWGSNGDWILGTRVPTSINNGPLPVRTPLRFNTILVSGHSYVCGSSTIDDVVHCWGHGHGRVLGRQSDARVNPGQDSVIMPVRGSVRSRSIVGANQVACALDLSGTPWCWGDLSRQWANTADDVAAADRLTPVPMAGGRVYTQITLGEGHFCGLDAAGSAYCAGRNDEGQLGIGSTQPQNGTPVPVNGGLRFRRLWGFTFSPNPNATCGITLDDDLYCWGGFQPTAIIERRGQSTWSPTRVAPGMKFRTLAVGAGGWCAITTDRAVVCW